VGHKLPLPVIATRSLRAARALPSGAEACTAGGAQGARYAGERAARVLGEFF
jgi:hypothetical protein